MIHLGLCCIFKNQPITFRRTTAKYQAKFDRQRQLENIATLCRHNAENLFQALIWCHSHGINDFRINSQILPLKTHPACGYKMAELPDHEAIVKIFKNCGEFCKKHGMRTTFHPDQFILLSSPESEIVRRSISDLVYQAELAEWVGSDVINIHGGGGYGDKKSALARLSKKIEKLPDAVRSRLTLENDDRVYTPEDLYPVCRAMNIPLVYDVHHHRCLNDGNSIEKTTDLALKTWNREPLFHVSSPLHGWDSKNPAPHHEYLDIMDFPSYWRKLGDRTDLTVEIEAKAKELAILKLQKNLNLKN